MSTITPLRQQKRVKINLYKKYEVVIRVKNKHENKIRDTRKKLLQNTSKKYLVKIFIGRNTSQNKLQKRNTSDI